MKREDLGNLKIGSNSCRRTHYFWSASKTFLVTYYLFFSMHNSFPTMHKIFFFTFIFIFFPKKMNDKNYKPFYRQQQYQTVQSNVHILPCKYSLCMKTISGIHPHMNPHCAVPRIISPMQYLSQSSHFCQRFVRLCPRIHGEECLG